MNIDGQTIALSPAWRIIFRRTYRDARRRGYGPLGARQCVEALIDRRGIPAL